MELNDLRLFASAARHGNLQRAAEEMHVTPSALSKAVRRLEGSLGRPLFDRVGKGLVLNDAGRRLQSRAMALLHLAEQTRSEFHGAGYRVPCRVAAPALLQARYAPHWARATQAVGPQSHLRLIGLFEDEAVVAVQRGDADFAVVSAAALPGGEAPADLAVQTLEALPMQVALAAHHPLGGRSRVGSRELLAHDFACPTRSLLCGIRRGTGSDGWRDDVLPRRIRYLADDLHALVTLVRSGQALAYLPAFLVVQEGLQSLRVTDCPFQCQEQAVLVWRPTQALGWQGRWVDALLSELNLDGGAQAL